MGRVLRVVGAATAVAAAAARRGRGAVINKTRLTEGRKPPPHLIPAAQAQAPRRRPGRPQPPATARLSPERAAAVAAQLEIFSPLPTPTPTPTTPPRAAYLHLPFCRRRCFYCDFPISVVGNATDSPRIANGMANYVDVLCREMAATHASSMHPLETIYFGGGTPSLLPPQLMQTLVTYIRKQFGIAVDAEITMEMDPGTFDAEKVDKYMNIGINRVSLGVQAFQPELLKAAGRSHDASEVHQALAILKAAGVRNWSLDLISGLPGQTLDNWQESLQQAIAAEPAHISVYDLQVEQGTAFGRWYRPGETPLPTDDAAADMYRAASNTLRAAGYEHYEVSNYAKEGCRSRHNQVYWKGVPFYGFGLGAASYFNRQRYSRPKKLAEYSAWVAEYEAAQGAIDWPEESREDRLLEALMLRLRTRDGLWLPHVAAEFGEDVAASIVQVMQSYAAQELVQGIDENGNTQEDLSIHQGIRLTDPEGLLFSNEVLAQLFSTFSEGLQPHNAM
eukprot:jgi/Chlat1/7477/Chrsp6S07503